MINKYMLKVNPKFIIYLLSIICLYIINCKPQNTKPVPKAINGILDLRQWEFTPTTTNDGTINLDGEWEFYPGEFCDPDPIRRGQVCKSPTDEIKYIPVPSQWQNHGYPSEGYATYRLKVLLSEMSKGEQVKKLSMEIPSVSTAYSLFINGKLLAAMGKVGKSKVESVPLMRNQIVELDNSAEMKELEILVHVSNFLHAKAGLRNVIRLGDSSILESKSRSSFVLDLIVFSCLAIIGIYHLGLFLSRRKDRSPLYFGIFCILIALRTVSMNELMIMDAIPSFPFLWVVKLEYFSFYFGSFLFLQFVQSLFPEEFSKKWFWGFSIVLIPSSLVIVLLPFAIFNQSLGLVQVTVFVGIFYTVFVLVLAIIRQRMGARLFLLGFLIFALAISHDILRTRINVYTPFLTSHGLLTFTLFQAIILSRRFAHGFEMAETLSEDLEKKSQRLEETALELKTLNENLETKVKERTKELEESKKGAEKLAESRKRLSIVGQMVAGIVHDIKNPIASIKGLAESLHSDKIKPEKKQRNLRMILQEMDRLSDLVFEILDFSKGKIQLELSKVNLSDYLSEILFFQETNFQYYSIRSFTDFQFNGEVQLDTGRMRRVLVNLIQNALEVMYDGKKDYFVKISTWQENDQIAIAVEDNGPGLPASMEEKIFQAFATEGKAKGTGLGLFMSKQIVEAHGGSLSYKTQSGEGTTFYIKLPLEVQFREKVLS